MKTTDSFTPRWSGRPADWLFFLDWQRLLRWPPGLRVVALVCALMVGAGLSQARAAELGALTLSRTADGLFLSAVVHYQPGPAVEDALLRSVPVYFVAQADVLRERWYWSDKRVASVSRTYRLAYQPLTRRWRVSVSSAAGAGVGLQYALHQNHDSLTQALGSITRLSNWPLAEAAQLVAGEAHWVDFRFKLDMALLPRPFQLGSNARSDWNLDIRRSLDVPEQITEEPPEAPGAVGAAPDVTPPGKASSGNGISVGSGRQP